MYVLKYLKALLMMKICSNVAFSQETKYSCTTDQCENDDVSMRVRALEETIVALNREMDSRQSNFLEIIVDLNMEIDLMRSNFRATYVRWGRTVCPDTATLVYEGKKLVHDNILLHVFPSSCTYLRIILTSKSPL